MALHTADGACKHLTAGIATKIGDHSFLATGITACLKNGGALEKAAAMANPRFDSDDAAL